MTNATAYYCNAYADSNYTSAFTCIAPTGPENPNLNDTNSPNTYSNETGLANHHALSSCCLNKVLPYGGYRGGDCFEYCTEDNEEDFLETKECILNYTMAHPEGRYTGLNCDDRSGATMLGRTGGWAGLLMLGLVVSATL